MEWINLIWTFLNENLLVIVATLWGLAEVLAATPWLKSNSVFQLIYNGLKGFKEFLEKLKEKE